MSAFCFLVPLQTVWHQFPDSVVVETATMGVYTMRELNSSVAKLRVCYSIQAVEKASLSIASLLLQLVSCSGCRNIFLCLQQAAMFASHAPKGGTSDHHFHARLPSPEACTPRDALLVIGRADCLNSLHFCQEAAFLCSYVANVCSLHRASKFNPLIWDERWSLLSSLNYDLSISIRNVAGALLQDQVTKDDTTGTWGVAVIEEFRRARDDGVLMKSKALDCNISDRPAGLLSLHLQDNMRLSDSYGDALQLPLFCDGDDLAEDECTLQVVPAMEEFGLEEISDPNVGAIELFAV